MQTIRLHTEVRITSRWLVVALVAVVVGCYKPGADTAKCVVKGDGKLPAVIDATRLAPMFPRPTGRTRNWRRMWRRRV